MRRRHSRWLIVLAVCLIALLLPAAQALADSGGEFLPPPPKQVPTWSQAPLYDRYPVWHYTYGAQLQGADTIHRLFYLANVLQVGKAWLLKLAIRTVEYAVHVDLAGSLVERGSVAMRSLVGALWQADGGALVVAGLLLAAAAAFWRGLAAGRRLAGLRVLAGAAVIVVGSYALFEVAPQTLTESAGIARGLGGQVLTATGSLAAPTGTGGTPRDRLLRAAGEEAWRVMVLEPWIDGEFSGGAEQKPEHKDGDVPGGKWLKETPTDRTVRYRSYLLSGADDFAQWDDYTVLDSLPRRVLVSVMSGLVTLVYAAALLGLAGGVLYYQVLLVMILALAPLWLLGALWHPSGLTMARGAVVRAIGALVTQVVLIAVLGVALMLVLGAAHLAGSIGWMAQAALMALVAATLFRYRLRWLRWGREVQAGEEAAARGGLLAYLRRRRAEPQGADRPSRVEPAAVLAQLPRLREEAPRPEAEPQTVQATVAVVELAAEMRLLRSRLTRSEVTKQMQVLESLAEGRTEVLREQGVAAGSGPSTEAAAAQAPSNRRSRPETTTQRVHRVKNRQ